MAQTQAKSIKTKKPRRKAVKKKTTEPNESQPQKKSEPGSVYRKLAAGFVFLTVVLVAVVLYFTFSKMKITIIPTQEKITESLIIDVIDQSGDVSAGQGIIAGAVKQVPVEETKTFTSSGKEVLGEEVVGQVTIINNYIKNQPLVASTRLLSADGKLFRLKDTVNVPAGGKITAEIYADQPSREMAIGPTKFTMPGLWAGIQDKIYAQSDSAMKYSEKAKYIIQQSDIDNAVNELRKNLETNTKKQIGQAYENYSQVLYQVDNNSLSQEIDSKVGEEKQKFTIKMKTMVTVVAFNDEEVYNQAKAKLENALADDKQIAEFNKQNMAYNIVKTDLAQGMATINVNFEAKAILKDGAAAIKKNYLAGMDLEQLKSYLDSLPEVSGYEIKFSPAFVKKAPNLVDRIEIEIKK